jgi:hypothetical protein
VRTRVVVLIEHPDDVRNIDKESIEETFLEAGDVAWTTEVESIEIVQDQS